MILQGIRCYLRLNLAEVLPTKKKVFRNLKFLLAGTDAVFNLFADLRFILFKNVPADPSIYDLRSHLDRDLYEPVEYFNRDSLSRRGVEEINWILDYPWILEKKPDAESSKYYFSSVSRRFFYRIIRVKKVKSNRPGFVLVCVRDNHMTVPYLFSDEYIIIARILVNLMIELRCSMLTIFHVKLIPSISKIRSPFLFRKVIRKPYLISRNLGIDGDLKFQDGDGDCAFY